MYLYKSTKIIFPFFIRVIVIVCFRSLMSTMLAPRRIVDFRVKSLDVLDTFRSLICYVFFIMSFCTCTWSLVYWKHVLSRSILSLDARFVIADIFSYTERSKFVLIFFLRILVWYRKVF